MEWSTSCKFQLYDHNSATGAKLSFSRGKKIFRKFVDDTDDWDESEITADNTSSRARPFTRSSIKPRLLFPTEEQRQMRNASADYVDEEATTEVEEQDEVVDSEMTDVEASTDKEVLITPVKETAEPASPPASGRATRGSTRKVSAPEPVEYLPTNTTRMKKASPFDSWQRSKAGRETKRKGEDGVEGSGGSASKKVKRTTA